MRLAGISGVLGVALPGAALFFLPIWGFPGTNSSAADLTAFAVAHHALLGAAMILNVAGVGLWMLFGAGVWLRLRQVSGPEKLLSAGFAFGLIGFVTLLLAGFVAMFIISYRAPDVPDIRLLYDVAFGLLAMSGAPTALALACYAAVAFRHPALSRFTAWLAVLAAAAHVVILFSFVVPRGFFSLEGQVITVIPGLLFAWILATSIALLTIPDQRRLRGSARTTGRGLLDAGRLIAPERKSWSRQLKSRRSGPIRKEDEKNLERDRCLCLRHTTRGNAPTADPCRPLRAPYRRPRGGGFSPLKPSWPWSTSHSGFPGRIGRRASSPGWSGPGRCLPGLCWEYLQQ